MLSDKTIFARNLPEKTLALTFDDGPGPHTLELAEYLASEDALATFFMLGRNVLAMPDVVRKVHALGHLVGNHSYDHENLNKLFKLDAVGNIIAGEKAVIKVLGLDSGTEILFRAPYGDWNMTIGWDIPKYEDNADWWYWKNKHPIEYATTEILSEIEFRRKGIVCMHDADHTGGKNQTHEMIKILIPQLKKRGYSFVKLDEVELS